VNGAPLRIVLAERGPRGDYAVTIDAETLRIEGGSRPARQRAALRQIYGVERAGAWLWVGSGLVPMVLGGEDVSAEGLARVEGALRERLAALPGGAGRLARIDARRPLRRHGPWLTLALTAALGLAFALAPGSGEAPRFVVSLLLLASIGLLIVPWLVRLPLLASGCGAALVACAFATSASWLERAPLGFAPGFAGLLLFLRFRRERVLSVRLRSVLDPGVLLTLPLILQALTVAGGVALLATLAGFLVAPLVLRGWPEGRGPRLH
jgi:hypothetical protein